MNKIKFTITDNQIKFNRRSSIETIKHFLRINNIDPTQEEKHLLIESVINKIEIFERNLSNKLNIYLDHEKDIDNNYVNDILFKMHVNIGYFISVCVQQEYKHLTL